MKNLSSFAVKRLQQVWLLLKYTYGLVYFVAGLDKIPYLYFITTWTKYLSPYIKVFLGNIGIGSVTWMLGIGIFEILLGLTLLFYDTRLAAYVLALWLFVIALNLLSFGFIYFDLAVRDIVMAVGALALAWLTDVQEELVSTTA